MHGLNGMVSNAGSNTFTVTMMQGMPGVSLTTQSGTHYEGIDGTHMMGSSQLLSIDATMQPDGTWTATRVQARAARPPPGRPACRATGSRHRW